MVVSARKIMRLQDELGPGADKVFFADMGSVGHNPARIIPAWREFVSRFACSGVRIRGIGEPVHPGRNPDELVECQRHESLVNLAFAGAGPFWLVCPYDVSALAPQLIVETTRSHPIVTLGGRSEPSRAYSGLEAASALLSSALPKPPASAAELRFEATALQRVRRVVADFAVEAGLDLGRRINLTVAVNEIATNSITHGGGRGVLRIWSEPRRRLVCEVEDAGRIDDPLIDRIIPGTDDSHGRGLWMANQLCDLVQVRSSGAGTIVRLHLSL